MRRRRRCASDAAAAASAIAVAIGTLMPSTSSVVRPPRGWSRSQRCAGGAGAHQMQRRCAGGAGGVQERLHRVGDRRSQPAAVADGQQHQGQPDHRPHLVYVAQGVPAASRNACTGWATGEASPPRWPTASSTKYHKPGGNQDVPPPDAPVNRGVQPTNAFSATLECQSGKCRSTARIPQTRWQPGCTTTRRAGESRSSADERILGDARVMLSDGSFDPAGCWSGAARVQSRRVVEFATGTRS